MKSIMPPHWWSIKSWLAVHWLCFGGVFWCLCSGCGLLLFIIHSIIVLVLPSVCFSPYLFPSISLILFIPPMDPLNNLNMWGFPVLYLLGLCAYGSGHPVRSHSEDGEPFGSWDCHPFFGWSTMTFKALYWPCGSRRSRLRVIMIHFCWVVAGCGQFRSRILLAIHPCLLRILPAWYREWPIMNNHPIPHSRKQSTSRSSSTTNNTDWYNDSFHSS